MDVAGMRRLISGEARGAHFAEMLFMGPLAAVAILVLQRFHFVSPSPWWVIPLMLVVGQLASTASGFWWDRSHARLRTNARVATQIVLVTAIIYATGWGPALAVGLVLVGQESLTVTGVSSYRIVLAWTFGCLIAGQVCVALHWAPTMLPLPASHGLAILVAIGIAFSYRSLYSALREKEDAATLTESHERRFRALVQSSSDLVFSVDRAGAVTYASPSSAKVLGFEPEELLGVLTGQLIHPDDLPRLRHDMGLTVDQPGSSVELSFRVRHRSRWWVWLEGVATNLLDDPAVDGIVINARDVTGRRIRMEQQAAISDLGREVLGATTLASAVNSASDAIRNVLHPRRCSISLNLESAESEAGGPGPDDQSLTPGSAPSEEAEAPRLRHPVGDPHNPLAMIEIYRATALSTDDEQFVEAVGSIVFSAAVRFGAEDAIRHQAMHDPLTGLSNRALFNDRLEQALARRARTSGCVGVMIVDLDGFKHVNDSLGHLVGDALLIAVADRFRARLRGSDTIARLGGDEFAILVDSLDAADRSGTVAQRVLDALVEPLALPGQEVAIGASVGIALTDDDDTSADRLLADADAAMYQAKRAGKGCYRVFKADMHAAAVERMSLDQDLRGAIRDHSLTVYYQPIIDSRTGRVDSFEALSRWRHPVRGYISPSTFIPVAEESGLIIELGREVLIEACRQTHRWHTDPSGVRPSISVNASRLQLAHPEFLDHVTDALAVAGVDSSALIIEVTESVLASESRSIITALDALRTLGVRVAIDDFGTGYSSFAALADLPIDILKIDKRFVDHVVHDEQGRGFVNAIMQLATTLHLETTAEGVELPEQRDALVELGCTHLQGFLYSQPLPADETYALLAGIGTGPAPVIAASA
jgi:diguanylate cyclase (GGDEF)-like protein/PAS domain S-box-containing protein